MARGSLDSCPAGVRGGAGSPPDPSSSWEDGRGAEVWASQAQRTRPWVSGGLRAVWAASDCAHVLPAVLGGPESRGVLRKMSDLLELMVKRMDTLARLENSSELHRAAGDGRFAMDR